MWVIQTYVQRATKLFCSFPESSRFSSFSLDLHCYARYNGISSWYARLFLSLGMVCLRASATGHHIYTLFQGNFCHFSVSICQGFWTSLQEIETKSRLKCSKTVPLSCFASVKHSLAIKHPSLRSPALASLETLSLEQPVFLFLHWSNARNKHARPILLFQVLHGLESFWLFSSSALTVFFCAWFDLWHLWIPKILCR